jgi:PAS domain S-box-containing protein
LENLLKKELDRLKQENHALTKSLYHTRCLADAAAKAIILIQNEICLEANQAAAEMFGFKTPSDLIGKEATKLITPESYNQIKSQPVNSSNSHEAVGIRKDGKLYPIALRKRPVHHPQALAFSIEDITRKNHSDKINKALFAISNAVNITLDLNHLYKQIHHLLSDILDVTNFLISLVNNEKKSIKFPYYVDSEDAKFYPVMEFEIMNSLTGLVVLQKKPILLNHSDLIKRRGKTPSWGPECMIWMGVPLMIKEEVIGVIAVQSYTDPFLYNEQDLQILTAVSDQVAIAIDRKRAEDSLRESEKKYRQLFNKAPAGMYEFDFTTRKFINVNQVMCSYLGYSKEEFLSMDPLDILTEESREHFWESYKTILKGDKISDDVEYHVVKKNGQTRCVLLNSDFIYDGEKMMGARVVVHDITERKKMEEFIIQSEKMLSIGGLAAGMAHEINNPLAGMIQSAQLILNRLTKDLPANHKAAEASGTSLAAVKNFMEKRDVLKNLENIHTAGVRAAKIIENMLSFAQKGNSTTTQCRLDELIDKTIEIAQNEYDLKKKFDFKQIKIARKYNPEVPAIRCEKSKIQQVLFNLLKNAAESMGSQNPGHRSPEIILRLQTKEQMVCIEIEDNGPGMDAEIQKRVFEPFFTTKGLEQGTGLGLSVSYFIIVKDHGGEMRVQSALGQGTKFIIKLPVG